MRILHFVPDIGVANGVMSVVLNYFRAMPEDIKFDVMYFKECEKDRRADIEALGGRVFHINTPGLKSFLHSDLDEFFKAHEGEYAAVHIHAPYMTCLIAPKAKKYGIKKIAAHCHSTLFSLNPENAARNKLLNMPTRIFADKLFACGTHAGEFWYGEKSDFTVLTNAIDCEKYRYDENVRKQKRDELGISDSQLAVGHIGVTSPPLKNHPYLLKVFAKIKEQRPDAVLLMAGAEETPELRSIADELGIANEAKFLGRREDIPELLNAMDVFIFPSIREGLPVSVVEAQAAGLPVLMSDTVTDEVCVTDRIYRMSTDREPQKWAEKAISEAAAKREDNCEIMKNGGWDIRTAAEKLVEYYFMEG